MSISDAPNLIFKAINATKNKADNLTNAQR